MWKSAALLALAFLWSLPAPAPALENFPRPGSVESRVAFWTRIYTEVGTDGGLIHDSQDLDRVYAVLQFPEGSSWRARQRRIRQEKEHVRSVLRRLARGKRSGLSAEEARLLALFPEGVSNATLSRAARRVRFQLGQADKFRAGLARARIWEPHIREVIAEHRVPAELAALPHVESSYNPGAVSKVGAAGLWQFTRSTGRRFMRVDHVVDERFDPYRSSEAAAELLRQNYEKTGSWPLAITAYNHGLNGVRRAMRKLGTSDIGTIIERYRSRTFGFASQNFYAEFLAALHVDLNAERYFGRIETELPEEPETVHLDHYYPARALADAFGVTLTELRRLNPALRGPVWNGQKHVPRGFELRLPPAPERPPAATLLASISQEQRFARQRPDLFYRVQRGDTVSTIARRHGVRASDIVALNGLRNRHRIRVGQRLRIPEPGGSRARVASRRSAPPAERVPRRLSADGTYTVRSGDTLTGIARELGVTTEQLVLANALARPDRLQVGQVLRLASVRPDEADAEVTPPTPEPAAKAAPQEEPPPAPPSEATLAEATPVPAPPEARPVELASVPYGPPAPPEASIPVSAGPGPAIELDRSRYALRSDHTLRVQPEETLGHYAHWLEIPTQRLRRLNGLRYGRPVVIGQRLRLDFSRVSPETFEERRIAHHRALREQYFREHRIAGTAEHVLRRGETLWELSRRRYGVPVWLLSDYNREIDLTTLRAGVRLTIPQVERVGGESGPPQHT